MSIISPSFLREELLTSAEAETFYDVTKRTARLASDQFLETILEQIEADLDHPLQAVLDRIVRDANDIIANKTVRLENIAFLLNTPARDMSKTISNRGYNGQLYTDDAISIASVIFHQYAALTEADTDYIGLVTERIDLNEITLRGGHYLSVKASRIINLPIHYPATGFVLHYNLESENPFYALYRVLPDERDSS